MAAEIYTDGRYVALNPSYHVEDSAWKAAFVVDLLVAQGMSPRTIVEVGCGAGEILAQLKRMMPGVVRMEGWDVSPQAIDLAMPRATEGLTFHVGDGLSLSRERFDVALCLDVIEHVEDYIGFLRRLRPLAEWKVFHIPLELSVQSLLRVRPIMKERARVGHLHHFTKETALATLRVAGYQVAAWRYTSGALDLPNKSALQRMARIPRRCLGAVNQDLNARILGGCSILAMAQ